MSINDQYEKLTGFRPAPKGLDQEWYYSEKEFVKENIDKMNMLTDKFGWTYEEAEYFRNTLARFHVFARKTHAKEMMKKVKELEKRFKLNKEVGYRKAAQLEVWE